MIKRTGIWAVLAAGFVMTATAVWAQEGSSVPGKLTMGAEFSYFKYEEPDFMEQTGPLFGLEGQFLAEQVDYDSRGQALS